MKRKLWPGSEMGEREKEGGRLGGREEGVCV